MADILQDGDYTVEVSLKGGSGKASVNSPARLSVADGKMQAKIEWSSPNYDYMEIDGKGYYPVNDGGNSAFVIDVAALDCDIDVLAETIAMSEPHMIEYTLYFDSESAEKDGISPVFIGSLAAAAVIIISAAILIRKRKKDDEK